MRKKIWIGLTLLLVGMAMLSVLTLALYANPLSPVVAQQSLMYMSDIVRLYQHQHGDYPPHMRAIMLKNASLQEPKVNGFFLALLAPHYHIRYLPGETGFLLHANLLLGRWFPVGESYCILEDGIARVEGKGNPVRNADYCSSLPMSAHYAQQVSLDIYVIADEYRYEHGVYPTSWEEILDEGSYGYSYNQKRLLGAMNMQPKTYRFLLADGLDGTWFEAEVLPVP